MKTKTEALILPVIVIILLHAAYAFYFPSGIYLHSAASVVDALLIFLCLAMRSYSPSKIRISDKLLKTSGVSLQMITEAVESGNEKNRQLSGLAQNIKNANVRKTILDITGTINEIIDDIQKDPKDLKIAKKFLTYYLDTTIKITKRFLDLSQRSAQSGDVLSSLGKTEDTLVKMSSAFRQMLNKLLEDDVLDLNSELELLDKTIIMEGYDDEKN